MPYVDPHAYQFLDWRVDPTQHDNPPEFWYGYGKFRQGTPYTQITDPTELAGWCYGLAEGKEPPKPLWMSRHFWHGIVLIGVAIWGSQNLAYVIENPAIATSIAAVAGVSEIILRKMTRAMIR